MRLLVDLLLSILWGFAVGYVLSFPLNCAMAWHRGESADPRCVYNWQGYVEVYSYKPRVRCVYRPQLK